jgi:alpha-tubulin suppressor-like RCC1 family protein
VSNRILRVVVLVVVAILPLQVATVAANSASVPAITALAAGIDHTCALTSAGEVTCWGWNESGQLGNGTTTDSLIPVAVLGLASGVTAIVAGGPHTCGLTSGGGVECWGDNGYIIPGHGSSTQSNVPIGVAGIASGATAIAAGNVHTFALTSVGRVKCWGNNAYGELGNGTTTDSSVPVDVPGLASGVSAIAAGGGHTCALTSSGGVKCWGWNQYGQLGNLSTTDSSVPVDVSGLASGVTDIAGGQAHTCALTSGGVKCWGDNFVGQLGNGTTTRSLSPVDVSGLASGVSAIAAGGSHTCAVTRVGGVKCWGWNRDGQLGNGTTTNDSLTPVAVLGLASGVTAIAAGGGHTCAVTSDREVKCWGYNSNGQLGNGTTTNGLIPVDVATGPPPAPNACPTLPTDAATLSAFLSDGLPSPDAAAALACFGRREITVEAYVPRDVAIDAPWFPEVEPTWLSPNGLPQAVVAKSRTSTGFGVRVPPRLQHCAGATPLSYPGCPFAALAGRFVRMSGHFNDPAARTCHFVSPQPAVYGSRAELITLCRGEFVVDFVTALGGALPGTDTVGSPSTERAAPSGPPVVAFVTALLLTLLALVSLPRTRI